MWRLSAHICTCRRQRLAERSEEFRCRRADFAGQRGPLIEGHCLWPGPEVSQLDAGTQMDVAAAKALEECIELLVILGPGVLPLPKPRPKVLPDLVVVVRADLSEIASGPTMDILGRDL